MARVFDAFDDRLERPVAVKLLRPETGALPGMRKRFQQEARLAARLIHPNIVAVLDYGEDHASSYLVMERLPGTTLRDEMARWPMSAARVVLVMTETLAALAAAHKFGVLHRDIKPSNILLQDDGHTKISDFGIAKSVDILTGAEVLTDDMTLTGMILGTPGYLAPERRSGHPATAQSDIYSVGAVLVEALTGRRAPPGAMPTDGLPPRLADVARRALATDPNRRFPSADAMLHALRPPRPSTVAPPVPTEQVAPTPLVTLPLPAVPAAATHCGHRGDAPTSLRREASTGAPRPSSASVLRRPGRGGVDRGPRPPRGSQPAHETAGWDDVASRSTPGRSGAHGDQATRSLSCRCGPAWRPRAGRARSMRRQPSALGRAGQDWRRTPFRSPRCSWAAAASRRCSTRTR